MLDWTRYETVLLDMDGTILDLAYDNHFWRELIPRYVASHRGQSLDAARDEVFGLFAEAEGRLEWYCIDHWSGKLSLDLRGLKSMTTQRIRYLPGARDFLRAARGRIRCLALVTNAHGYTLSVKRSVAGLDRYLDCFVTSHELGAAKEQPEFWPALQDRLGFDPASTLFVDDSESVLDAAEAFGLDATLAVCRPDSRAAPRLPQRHRGVDGLGDLLDG